jgi:phosphoribosylamine-glycine ligase
MHADLGATDVVLFHAGTSFSDADKSLKTSGGRVIASTATAPTLEEAVAKAYKGVECIHFEGMQFRKDIAGRALKK